MPASGTRVIAHPRATGHDWENSFAAFRAAVRLRADGGELDIHTTADGKLLVHHDPVIAGLGPIASRSLEAIRATPLPNGEPIPILEKALPASADVLLLAAVDGAPVPSRCAVHSFDHRIVARLGARRPSLRRGILSAPHPPPPPGPMAPAGPPAPA